MIKKKDKRRERRADNENISLLISPPQAVFSCIFLKKQTN